MKMGLVVLWIFSVSGFSFGGGVHTGPGWWSTKHIFTEDQIKHCYVLGMQMVQARSSVTDYGCWAAGDGPPVEDWAKVKR